MQIALYISSAIVTISSAVAVIAKFLKKSLVKATKETVREQMIASQEKFDTEIENLNSKIEDLNNKLDKYVENQDSVNQDLRASLLASTRDRINQAHDYYTKKKYIGSHSLFVVEELYASYKKLGGNSFIKRQMEDIRKLEVRSAETDDR